MKKQVISALLCTVCILCNAQLKISTNGNVGIGTTNPEYKLDVNISTSDFLRVKTWTSTYVNNSGSFGSLCIFPNQDFYLQIGKDGKRAGEIWGCEIHGIWLLEYSDANIKENIRPLKDCLNKLKRVDCVQYTLKSEYVKDLPIEKQEIYTQPEYGFVAQNLQSIFPEVVVSDTLGTLSVKYTRMIPVLVEAIKEQQKIIDSLYFRLNELCNTFLWKGDNGNNQHSPSTMIEIYQNIPNPTDGTTTISGFLPSEIENAALYIYDVHGKMSRNVTLTTRGYFTVMIKEGDLAPGVYFYVVHGDNFMSETKQMIISK